MRRLRSLYTLAAMAAASTAVLTAQSPKAGLWEVTTTMTWQQSPFPQGMNPMGGPKTYQVCVTQDEIDKYGTVPPQTHGDCQITDVTKKANGMSASLVCTGSMTGQGTVDATWTADASSTSNIHFTGSMQMGPHPSPIEWTINASSTYKSADCGSVKPNTAH